MKIIRIEMTNYKKVKALDVRLDGDNLVVAGPPDSGKTTAVSALWDAITPIGEPLTHGERKGSLRVTLGEPGKEYRIFVERKFTPKTNTISIVNQDGKKLTKGTVVDLLNKISYEPLKILDLKGNELTKYLLSCVTLPEGVSLAELDKQRAEKEEIRLEKRRELDIIKKRLPEKPAKVERIDTAGLEQELAGVSGYNVTITNKANECETKVRSLSAANEHIAVCESEIDRLERALVETKEGLKRSEEHKQTLEKEIAEIKNELESTPLKDPSEIQQRLNTARTQNVMADDYDRWLKEEAELTEAEKAFEQADDDVKAVDQWKKDALENAKFPAEGFEVKDGTVYYFGFPFENCGTEKQIRGAASLVAAKMEGEIKVVRIDRAESMGKVARNALLGTCKELGVQVCMSRVTEESIDENEIQIIDGVYEEE
jgi:predicted ATP-dependent endonuclease of OLD family